MHEFLGTIVSGGLTGLLGIALQGVGEYFRRKQEHQQRVEMRRMDIEEMDKEWQYRDRAAAREGELALQTSADDLQKSSYTHDTATYSNSMEIKAPYLQCMLVIVDVVRGITRPLLTFILCVLMWKTLSECRAVMKAAGINGLDPITAMQTYHEAVSAILYAGTAGIIWWFGGRSRAVQGKR